ncbi:methyltransferase [Halosquirtibacter laminarini]|uniref:Methyltransferase n=1 Tax=Halosquirtibacter laminarini TaxID=3374600 RepID=A0AC61NFB6_9BACT|nr:methyltransferase [Prolixibacteraceae bacterium]
MGRNNFFQFKQFKIVHELSGMKVGTDGVLLGAWASHPNPKNILDIGAGSGLMTLMMAQRYDTKITGVEIDQIASKEANKNLLSTSWSDRVEILNYPIQQYRSEKYFDLIVSNPPFFNNGPKSPSSSRKNARHTDTLSFTDLLSFVSSNLNNEGVFCLILPFEQLQAITEEAKKQGLYIQKICYVRPKKDGDIKRILVSFGFDNTREIIETYMYIEKTRHVYSEEYKKLTKDFYLNM